MHEKRLNLVFSCVEKFAEPEKVVYLGHFFIGDARHTSYYK